MRPIRSLLTGASFVLLLATAAPAHSGTTVIAEVLDPKRSLLEIGCQGPCECPIIDFPAHGTFALVDRGFDGLYQHYDVIDVDWDASSSTESRRYKGAGRYRVGGEFAVMQEMVLDLVNEKGATQRFSSGLVPGGGEFPKLDIKLAVHDFFCMDTVFAIHAFPAAASVGSSQLVELRQVQPNPFRGSALLELSLGRPAAVAVEVYDPSGRRVRVLASGFAMDAGQHWLRWDGAKQDGSAAPAGIYRLRVRANGREAWKTAVKLE